MIPCVLHDGSHHSITLDRPEPALNSSGKAAKAEMKPLPT